MGYNAAQLRKSQDHTVSILRIITQASFGPEPEDRGDVTPDYMAL
jgi:hypothetical protein